MSMSKSINQPSQNENNNYLLTIKEEEDENFNFIKNKNLKSLDFDSSQNGNPTRQNLNKLNAKRNAIYSDELSLDQIERKLNRFSIAKDSLESSLVYVPYSIEESLDNSADNQNPLEAIREEDEKIFITPTKLINLNRNTQEYSTAEQTKHSNKLNELQKSIVQHNVSNKNYSRIINTSFHNKKNHQQITGINNFLNTSVKNGKNNIIDYKNTNSLTTSSKENGQKFSNLLNSNDNKNNAKILDSNQLSNDNNKIKALTYNLNINSNYQSNPNVENSKKLEQEDFDEEIDVEKTAKIKYKYISSLFRASKNFSLNKDKKQTYFWFATYDKLMRNKNIKKILNYYEKERYNDKSTIIDVNNTFDSKILSNANTVKKLRETPIILKEYDLFFEMEGIKGDTPKTTKAYLRPKKEGFCFLNLYYLNVEQINLIYNYINKTNISLSINDFENTNNNGDTSIINKSHNYGELICLGSVINTNIYTLTKKYVEKSSENIRPKLKYLIKLIKNLCKIFKNYSFEFFLYHIYSKPGINKNLTPQEVHNIRSHFSKENNLKELRFSSKNNLKSNINNKNNTISNIDNESLELKIKNFSRLNSNLFSNHDFYGNNNNNSNFFRNDSLELEFDKNLIKNQNLNNKENLLCKEKYNTNNNFIFDISCNNVYFENNNNTINNDSLGSNIFQKNYINNEKKILKGYKYKENSAGCKSYIKKTVNKNSISEKKNLLLKNYYSKENGKQRNIDSNSNNTKNNSKVNKFSIAINMISPNETDVERSDYKNPHFIRTEEANSFINKELIDLSLLNSNHTKSVSNNNKNNDNSTYFKNKMNNDFTLNSFTETNINTVGSKKGIFHNHIKKLEDREDKFKTRLNKVKNNAFNINEKSNFEKNYFSNSKLNKNNNKFPNDLSNSGNKINLNFISSLNNSRASNINPKGFQNNNYFLKAKAELSAKSNKIKIFDDLCSVDSELVNTTEQNNFNHYSNFPNFDDNIDAKIIKTQNNLEFSNEKHNQNIRNFEEKILSSPLNEKKSSAKINKISTNDQNNNSNIKVNSKLSIPKNKLKNQEIDTKYYSAVKSFASKTTEKKARILNSDPKKNSLRKVDKNKQNLEKNSNTTYKSNCFQTSRNYNTDDISFNIKKSFNSMSKSIKNDSNNNYFNTNNSNIFVVSRDLGSRAKTDFEDSDDSDENCITNELNENLVNSNLDNNRSVYGTPTKKKVLKYYS